MRRFGLRAHPTALLAALLATLLLPRPARAHRLEGEYRVLPGGKVRVEAWFETGDAPHGAKVRVYRADGSPLLPEPGELDKDGAYVFAYEKAEPLKVVISGEGHRKELLIPAAELSSPGTSPPDGGPARERGHEFPIKDLLLGITFLLALAAFVLSLRNARRLRDSRRG